MAKNTKNTKVVKTNQNVALEHNETIDDNILPDADELRKYHDIDPDIVKFMIQHSTREQSFRIDSFDKRLIFLNRQDRRAFCIGLCKILVVFLIVALGIISSFYLLLHDKVLTGSILGGGAIFIALIGILQYKEKSK